MSRATVAAGDGHRASVMGPQQLQPVHHGFVHRALAGLTTRHLGKREVGPAVCRPGVGGIAHFVTPCNNKFIFESTKDPLPRLHKLAQADMFCVYSGRFKRREPQCPSQPPFGSPRGTHPRGVFYLFGLGFDLPLPALRAAAFLPAAVYA